jgi:riboflavin kinase/FMN adenylyltransferase
MIFCTLDQFPHFNKPISIAVGNFDGLHLGHQAVIQSAVEHTLHHHSTPILLTFHPHPVNYFSSTPAVSKIMDLSYQEFLLKKLGVDSLVCLSFNSSLANSSPEEFIQSLQNQNQIESISVGYDWIFGKGRSGNIHSLMNLGNQMNFTVHGIPNLIQNNQVISSTLLRESIKSGNLTLFERLTGRPYAIYGKVKKDKQLARQLGFPTANIPIHIDLTPPLGVYSVQASINNHTYKGIANLGLRPTLESQDSLLIEAHFFHLDQDLYNQFIEVQLLHFIRPEKKFNSIDELKSQIILDIKSVEQC